MATRARQIIGFTLVEVLIVIAILASLAAISVPFMAKYGALASQDVVTTARDVQELLRSAQIYASSNNVDTAVIYSTTPRNDSLSGAENLRVINGAALVRRLKRDDAARMGLVGDNYYIPIQNRDGAFRLFSGEACLALIQPRAGQPNFLEVVDLGTQNGSEVLAYTDMGMNRVEVVDTDGIPVPPVTGFPQAGNSFYPAHIFDATGQLRVAASDKQRFQLWVTAYPDATERDRYVQYAETDGVAIPYARTLELYRTLGRVKLQL